MKITVLGSGTSHGIPVIGCSCPVCASEDSRDKRMRCSVYIEGNGGERAIIDAGPEFRLQAVRAGVTRLDAIFLTHAHADHVHGLDDVRSLTREHPLPVYGNERTIAEMRERFSYVWWETQKGGGKPKLMPFVVEGPVQIGGLCFKPTPVKHGVLDILGWEVREEPGKSFVYLTDTSAIPADTHMQLEGTRHSDAQPGDVQTQEMFSRRVIIIGGLRARPHETHFNFEEAMNAAAGLGAGKIFLTHICHSHFHAEIEEICLNFTKTCQVSDRLSGGTEIHPAYDGLELFL